MSISLFIACTFCSREANYEGWISPYQVGDRFYANHCATSESTLTEFLPEITLGHSLVGLPSAACLRWNPDSDLYSVGGKPSRRVKGNTSLCLFYFPNGGLPSLCTINILKGKTSGGCLSMGVTMCVPGRLLIFQDSACWAPMAALLPQLPTFKNIVRYLPEVQRG